MKNSNDRRASRLLLVLAAVCLIALPVVALAEDWFGEAIYSTIPSEPYNFAVGDLNGDGVDDVAYVASGYLIVLLNDGNAEFTHAGTYATVSTSLGMSDFNGDDALDIASFYLGTIKVFLNDGTGQFTLETPIDPPGGSAAWLTAGDLDLDGRGEIVALGDGGTSLFIYWNGPEGLSPTPTEHDYFFNSWPPQYPACGPIEPTKMLIADATGDGLPDVVVVGNVPNGFCPPEQLFRAVGILENLGGRTFTDSLAWPLVEQRSDGSWYDVGVADFNDDALPDLSVTPGHDGLGLETFLRQPDGSYIPGEGIAGIVGLYHATGDVDQDGTMDVVTDRGAGGVRVFEGHGDGTFELVQAPTTIISKVQLGHLDQNEGLDVVGFYGSTMRVLPNILFLTSDVSEADAPAREQIQTRPTVLSGGACTILAPAEGASPVTDFLVTDLQGRLVTTLAGTRASSTQFRATWDGRDRAGRDVPTGWYWIRHGDRTARAGKVLWIR